MYRTPYMYLHVCILSSFFLFESKFNSENEVNVIVNEIVYEKYEFIGLVFRVYLLVANSVLYIIYT